MSGRMRINFPDILALYMQNINVNTQNKWASTRPSGLHFFTSLPQRKRTAEL